MAKKRQTEPIIREKKRRGGRLRGVSYPASEKVARSNRTRRYVHGESAEQVTELEARRAALKKLHPDAVEIADAYEAAIFDGDADALRGISVGAMVDSEILRRKAVKAIATRGAIVSEDVMTADGKVVGHRLKANPMFVHVHALNETLGHTAQDLQLTPKSRGEGARDAAMTQALKHDAMLRTADKSRCPAPAIETTAAKR